MTDDSFRLDAKNLTATTLDHLFAELHDGVEVESFDIRERAACGDGVAYPSAMWSHVLPSLP